MKKRILASFLSLCMLLTLLPTVALAAESESEDTVVNSGTWGGIKWTFEVTDDETGTGTLTISKLSESESPEINPRTGEPYERGVWREAVEYNDQGIYTNNDGPNYSPYEENNVTKLIIEEGVTHIGSYVATNLPATGELVIPSTVTYIGVEAFNRSNFSSLTFAEGSQLECIGVGAFKRLPITEVVLPEGLVCVHAWIFQYCENLQHVTIPAFSSEGNVMLWGTKHHDYEDPEKESNPSWVWSSEIFADTEKLQSVTFGNEAVKELFFENGRNGTGKDKIAAFSGLTAYTDLQDAIDAAADGGETVTLVQNVKVAADTTLEIPENVTLDLNGKTLTNEGTIVNLGTVSGSGAIQNNGTYADADTETGDSVTGTGTIVSAYTIAYDLCGGTVATPNPYYYIEGNAGFTLNNPTKPGYTFAGWTGTGLDGATKTVTIAADSTGDREYTATWTPIKYTITFDTDGGSEIAPITQDYGTSVTAPVAPTKPGYTFVGWEPTLPAMMPLNDLEVKALWAINRYTITFNTDGGSEIEAIMQDYGTSVNAPDAPTKPGYTFAGWEPELPETMPLNGLEVKALWTINPSQELEIGGATVIVPEGNVIDPETGTITLPEGGKVIFDGEEYELPEGGSVEVNDDGTVTLPEGGKVIIDDVVVELPKGAVIDSESGEITLPEGGKVIIDDEEYVLPEGGSVEVNEDGTVTLPGGTPVILPDGSTVTIPEGQTGTVETDGKVALPAGSTVTKDDQTTTLGNGGTVSPDGTVTHTPIRVPGTSGGQPPRYSITTEKTENGSVKVSPANAAVGTTVTIIVEPDKGYTLETLTVTDKNGNDLKLTKVSDTKYTFKMPASKVTVEATFMDDNTMLNYFVDVFASDYYYDAVLWAVENGITTGTSATTFSPNAVCTRAQVVTFLWRAAGSPEPVGAVNGFDDVASNAYYAKAVQWAVEQGITLGTGNNKFSPDAECTRDQIVTFLWRSQGSENVTANNPFVDIANTAYYYDAVLWAVENGITTGTSATNFSPNAVCTRAQIVTFLYRYMDDEK